MNYFQLGLFALYFLSLLSSGVGVYSLLDKHYDTFLNRSIFFGESLLLGAIISVGELLLLSLFGLYRGEILWTFVFLNYAFLFNRQTRIGIGKLLPNRAFFTFPGLIFIILIAVFFFRNCYFLADIDSHTSYLYTQKLWLSARSSIIGDPTSNIMIFYPQFDTIPYSLGLSIFGKETLFCQMINFLWRFIAILLVFGYASFRFNKYYGLAAVFFILLNDHIFYSGANHWVLINGAVIAFMFASAYNFWEARRQMNTFRFALALVFSIQLLANKFQVIYILFFLILTGCLIQPDLFKKIREIISKKSLFFIILFSFIFILLWFVKNFIITGVPTFPIFTGKLGVFDFSPEKERVFVKICGGINPLLFLKYINYLFIWPGINAAKVISITFSSLPILFFAAFYRNKFVKTDAMELCFWLGLSITILMGTCLASHWEPRYYRYPLGIMAFTAVLSLHFIFNSCFGLKQKFILYSIMIFLPLWGLGAQNEGLKIIFDEKGFFMRPTFKENLEVLTDKIHTDYLIRRDYPETFDALRLIEASKENTTSIAWDLSSSNRISGFFLPVRLAVVSLWNSNTIKWDSYASEKMIKYDLSRHGIKWILQLKNNKATLVSNEEFAQEAAKYERYPKKTYAVYGLPPELTDRE